MVAFTSTELLSAVGTNEDWPSWKDNEKHNAVGASVQVCKSLLAESFNFSFYQVTLVASSKQ